MSRLDMDIGNQRIVQSTTFLGLCFHSQLLPNLGPSIVNLPGPCALHTREVATSAIAQAGRNGYTGIGLHNEQSTYGFAKSLVPSMLDETS